MDTNLEANSCSGQSFKNYIWSLDGAVYKKGGSGFFNRENWSLGWMLGSASIILVLVVAMVAYMAIRRSETAMANLLAEKGSSLLKVFESALRTGMQGSAGLQLQTLLQEIATEPDIRFVAVTMPDGVIIAHSTRERLGEVFKLEGQELTESRLAALNPAEEEKWRFTHSEGQDVFLLYRHFTLGSKAWSPDVPEPTIFLGLDVSPFEITSSQNRSYVIMLSIVTLLVGMACLLAISFAQRAAESRKKQNLAESEVQRLEKEIRQSEKMAAIGTLAAGVAHEIRNPLSSIKGYATYFKQKFPSGSDDFEAASVMVNEVTRLNRVITDLLGLAKPSDVKAKPLRLEAVVTHVLRLLRQNTTLNSVEVNSHFAPHIPDVLGDMERLSQALLNLCLNAIDAMPTGGSLDIAVSGGKKHVCLVVRDTGKGISGNIINKIFDPYFTTKGSGTGLGLPMVHKIVMGHNGDIDVISHMEKHDANGKIVSRGETIFRVWLPVVVESNGNN